MKSPAKICSWFFVLFSLSISAQIPNGGFEDWDASGNPVGWQASNAAPSYTTIIKTGDAHSGSWAVQGNVVLFSIFTVGPSLYTGDEAQGFPINFRPQALEGYYKFNPTQDDFLQVQAHFQKDGTLMGVGANNLNPASVYTKFTVDFAYFGPEVPDTALIAIFVASTSGLPHVGTTIFIDDLAWGSATDITEFGEQIPGEFKLYQNYPNPFNPTTKISWQAPIGCHQSLKVFDVLGNEVATLVNEFRSAGSYEIEFNAEGLSSGIYFYKLQAGSFVVTKKMILIK